jgi:hypothetical protein
MTGGRFADCRSSRLGFVSRSRALCGRRRRRICRPPVRVQFNTESVERLCAVEDRVLGMDASGHHSD